MNGGDLFSPFESWSFPRLIACLKSAFPWITFRFTEGTFSVQILIEKNFQKSALIMEEVLRVQQLKFCAVILRMIVYMGLNPESNDFVSELDEDNLTIPSHI